MPSGERVRTAAARGAHALLELRELLGLAERQEVAAECERGDPGAVGGRAQDVRVLRGLAPAEPGRRSPAASPGATWTAPGNGPAGARPARAPAGGRVSRGPPRLRPRGSRAPARRPRRRRRRADRAGSPVFSTMPSSVAEGTARGGERLGGLAEEDLDLGVGRLRFAQPLATRGRAGTRRGAGCVSFRPNARPTATRSVSRRRPGGRPRRPRGRSSPPEDPGASTRRNCSRASTSVSRVPWVSFR